MALADVPLEADAGTSENLLGAKHCLQLQPGTSEYTLVSCSHGAMVPQSPWSADT